MLHQKRFNNYLLCERLANLSVLLGWDFCVKCPLITGKYLCSVNILCSWEEILDKNFCICHTFHSSTHSEHICNTLISINDTCKNMSFEKALWWFIHFSHYRIIFGCNTCHMYKRIQSLVLWFFIFDINIYLTKNLT